MLSAARCSRRLSPTTIWASEYDLGRAICAGSDILFLLTLLFFSYAGKAWARTQNDTRTINGQGLWTTFQARTSFRTTNDNRSHADEISSDPLRGTAESLDQRRTSSLPTTFTATKWSREFSTEYFS